MKMNMEELHSLIKKEQPNMCQMVIFKEGKEIYSTTGNSGNVIYIDPKNSLVISASAYFKLTVFDRIEFIEENVKPFILK